VLLAPAVVSSKLKRDQPGYFESCDGKSALSQIVDELAPSIKPTAP